MKMTKKTKLLWLVPALLLAAPLAAPAQNLKIGFVNVGRLINESPQAKQVQDQLQEEFAPRQREVIAMQTTLQEQQEKFQRDLEVMGPEQRRNAEREIRREELELQRSQQEFQEDVNLRRNEALGKLQRELLSQVQSYAAEQGYDLIVSDGVLYASGSIDITEQVLTGLKESFASPSPAN